jgi:hypothetical protein
MLTHTYTHRYQSLALHCDLRAAQALSDAAALRDRLGLRQVRVVCVCVCVRVCAYACVYVRVCMCVPAYVNTLLRVDKKMLHVCVHVWL